MSLARRLSLLLLSVATLLAPSTDAVRCLECNEMPGAARIPCPGMELINFGRKFDVRELSDRRSTYVCIWG